MSSNRLDSVVGPNMGSLWVACQRALAAPAALPLITIGRLTHSAANTFVVSPNPWPTNRHNRETALGSF
jgi:hypothetical protein